MTVLMLNLLVGILSEKLGDIITNTVFMKIIYFYKKMRTGPLFFC